MNFDFFLWPMLVPMIIPIIYCIKFKKESLKEIVVISLIIALIVISYMPILSSNFLGGYTYEIVKILLFIILPIIGLFAVYRNRAALNLANYGIKKEGLKKSLMYCLLFLPIMLVATFLVSYVNGVTFDADILRGVVSFFESFTEEFFFRGILFIYLVSRVDFKVAYFTSLASFVLMHPQNLTNPFIIGTIVQAILTLEIVRRSDNLIGAWLLHGANRFFSLAIIPLILNP